MIIDSNIIVRFVTGDNAEQSNKAAEFFGKVEKGKTSADISILVLDETIWVLQNYYDLKRSFFVPVLLKLLAYKKVRVIETRKEKITNILEKMIGTMIDFTDLYLLAISGEDKVFSFDKDLTA